MNDVTALAARFLQGVGLAECPLEIAQQRLMTYRRGSAEQWPLGQYNNHGC